MPKLDDWAVVYELYEYMAPEQALARLEGFVSDHDRFVDGTRVSTSVVRELNVAEKTASTLYTEYKLGEPNREFLQWINDNNYNLEDYSFSNIQ